MATRFNLIKEAQELRALGTLFLEKATRLEEYVLASEGNPQGSLAGARKGRAARIAAEVVANRESQRGKKRA